MRRVLFLGVMLLLLLQSSTKRRRTTPDNHIRASAARYRLRCMPVTTHMQHSDASTVRKREGFVNTHRRLSVRGTTDARKEQVAAAEFTVVVDGIVLGIVVLIVVSVIVAATQSNVQRDVRVVDVKVQVRLMLLL